MDLSWALGLFLVSQVSSPLGVQPHGTYYCKVSAKYSFEGPVPSNNLITYKPAVRLSNRGNSAWIERCSYSSTVEAITCERYSVDKIDYAPGREGLAKFYHFRGMLSVQIFEDLSFIEDMGRGLISFGKCKKEKT